MYAKALPNRFGYKKTYLSVEETRRQSWDHPVGDPFGGPAYGEYRMPVAAVVGAVMAAADIAATTLGILNGLALAGSALSFVGQVTGNSKLAMAGGIMSLGAGAMSVYNNWDKITTAFSGSEAVASGAENATAAAASESGNSIVNNMAADIPNVDVSAPTSASGAAMDSGLSSASNSQLSGLIAESNPSLETGMGSLSQQTPLTSAGADRALEQSFAPTAGETIDGVGPAKSLMGADPSAAPASVGNAGRSAITDPAQYGDGSTEFINTGNPSPAGQGNPASFSDWLKKNKEIVDIGSKAIGGVGDVMAKSAATKDLEEMRINAYKAAQQGQYARADELMARYSQSVKDLQIKSNINPNANIYNTPNGQNVTAGIINRSWAPRNAGA